MSRTFAEMRNNVRAPAPLEWAKSWDRLPFEERRRAPEPVTPLPSVVPTRRPQGTPRPCYYYKPGCYCTFCIAHRDMKVRMPDLPPTPKEPGNKPTPPKSKDLEVLLNGQPLQCRATSAEITSQVVDDTIEREVKIFVMLWNKEDKLDNIALSCNNKDLIIKESNGVLLADIPSVKIKNWGIVRDPLMCVEKMFIHLTTKLE